MENEIITFGTNYNLVPGIKVLIKSAKRICNNLTVIDLNLNGDVKKYMQKENVNIFDANYFLLKNGVDPNLSPYTLKVIFFYLYCKHISTANNVYMTDFADVLFQSNPFDIIKNDKPYVIGENALIKNCKVNSDWINICFNYDIYNILKNKEILNGGMYLGKREAIVFLLNQMTVELQQIISRIGNYSIPDQAALNKLVYFDQHRYNILTGVELFNMAHFSNESFKKVEGLYSFKNVVSKVIHQYKANKILEAEIYNQF